MPHPEVGALVELMVKHGVTRLVCGDVTLERPLPPPPAPPREATIESEVERLTKMSPEAQDKLLMLRRMPGISG